MVNIIMTRMKINFDHCRQNNGFVNTRVGLGGSHRVREPPDARSSQGVSRTRRDHLRGDRSRSQAMSGRQKAKAKFKTPSPSQRLKRGSLTGEYQNGSTIRPNNIEPSIFWADTCYSKMIIKSITESAGQYIQPLQQLIQLRLI